MNEADPEQEDDDRLGLINLYMATLQARMDPDQFDALAHAVHGLAHVLAAGGEGSFSIPDDDRDFTPEMHQEFVAIMGIMLTGNADHRVVEMPGPDGAVGFALVDAEAADDPQRLREIQEGVHQTLAKRDALHRKVKGIARASGMDPHDH
ncbi:hypothetical protein [Streptomyces sp. N35]|uniref:hypothetical protein n=1 Tax=Streptomyces sp. N35 TaxID=2795730 RepID=UPI0018F7C0C6|nr:hypothetical protein [Streptomyces sp. N35]